MLRNYVKIAGRHLVRNKGFTSITMLGLALGFAGFILAYSYIDRERSYDAWNPDYDAIYLVGADYQGEKSGEVLAGLAPAIAAQLPEVVHAGRINQAPFEIPFITDQGVFYVQKWFAADLAVAKMFKIQTREGTLDSLTKPKLGILSHEAGELLYHDKLFTEGLMMANRETGIPMQIDDIAKEPQGLSLIAFDFLNVSRDIAEGFDGVRNMPAVRTFIQVKPGTDISAVEQKINAVYRNEVSRLHNVVPGVAQHTTLYLDPLKNLHLKPRHGSNTGYVVIVVIGILSSVILLLAAINYTNLMVTQAHKRAKEIGLQKIFGISRSQLAFHFFMEILAQCLVAALLAGGLVILGQHALQKWLAHDLSAYVAGGIVAGAQKFALPLLLAALATAAVSGIYPAVVLSGYRPVGMLKGNFQTSHQTAWFRHALLTLQFVIALVFISSLFFVTRQLNFMRHGDKGFDPGQVVYIKNLNDFGNPARGIAFETVRNRLQAIPGVEYATVATSVPGGNPPAPARAEYQDVPYTIDHIGVDFEYFETMGMEVVEGRVFTGDFPADSANALVINEAAMKTLNIRKVTGQVIRGCDTDFRLVGVVRDAKMLGFDHAVTPTMYSIRNPCGQFKSEILVKIREGAAQRALASMEKDWSSLNTFDGDYFRYEFADQKYAALFRQQAQLESAVSLFAVLAIIVAMMGLLSMSAYSIRIREKEMTIRKVLGASGKHIFLQLNKPFFRIFLLANIIAVPIAYFLVKQWLSTFAYRIDIQWWMFALAGLMALAIALLTVSWQTVRAAVANPAESLRTD